ncbi:MAG: hypothetical protein HKL88_08990 [Bacteroidia bacterium]|jgi:hypothetical protein|nr:hypothetical protein [Bacteroidia bacterium]
MIWKVPYGFYKKNIFKIYLLFFALLCIMGAIGWFIKEKYALDETLTAGLTFFLSAGLLFILAPVIFQRSISEYEKAKKNDGGE